MKKCIKVVLLLMALWVVVTNFIFAISNPELTQTEVFLHLPKTVLLIK